MPGVADAVRQFGPAYLARHGARVLPSHRRALHDLAACRTATLGGHVHRCDACGYEHYPYHSCRNRSCPTCHGAATAAWLAAREAELLPVPYFHVVFTLPAALRDLVRARQRTLLPLLIRTDAESLQALAADPHYVGGPIGVLAVLHTWTRALVYHPHVHCLVPGGAPDPGDGTWRAARGDFLVPVRALTARFRGRFLARLKAHLPGITLPPSVWQTPWVVYCKPTAQGSGCVLPYLARYVHRVAITDARVVAVGDDAVTFSYKDAKAIAAPRWRTMTLPGEEFLRRFLQHVLPRGVHKVRYYGLWHPAARRRREALQRQLAASPTTPHPSSVAAEETTPALARTRDEPCCPACGHGTLRVVGQLPRAQSRRLPSGIPP